MVKYRVHTLVRSPGGEITSESEHTKEIPNLPAYFSPVCVNLVHLCFGEERPEATVYSKVQGGAWTRRLLTEPLENDIEYGALFPEKDHLAPATPAPESNKRKKGANETSPGSVLDSDEAKLAPLRSASDAYSTFLSSMAIAKDLFQTPRLGSLTSVDLPHTGSEIDMRFTRCFPDGLGWGMTPVGAELTDLLRRGTRRDVLLIGKSGCGKTSAIFDAATTIYCLLFTATSSESREEKKREDPGAYDSSFAKLVDDVRSVLKDNSLSNDTKGSRCELHILACIVARMLVLHHFMGLDGATPKDWLVYQLTKDMHLITDNLYKSLRNRRRSFLGDLLTELEFKLGKNIFYAFDEAQYGYELLKDDQSLWKRSTGRAVGIASPFLRLLPRSSPVAIAGTALSLHSVACCQSDLGKRGRYEELGNFPPISVAEVENKLSGILDLGQVELSNVQLLWKLEGRGRLVGGLLGVLSDVVREQDTRDKKALLEMAIERHYNSMKSALIKRIEERLCTDSNPSPLRHNPCPRFPDCLESLAISCLLGGSISKLATDFNIDLLHVGLCSLKRIEDQDNYVLEEELGKEAILDLAEKHKRTATIFARVAQLCQPANGHAMEPLLVAELRDWSVRNNDATVKEFLEQLYGNLPDNMPHWIDNSKFNINGGFNKGNYISRKIKNDVGFIQKTFEDKGLRNRLLSPSTVKRPDFEAVMEGQGGNFWFLSVSSKLYSAPFNDTSEADLRSTNPNMFYMKKDGSENHNCRHLRGSWVELVAQHQDCFERNLRIHFCLPDVKRRENQAERVFIDENSIVAYITAANVSNIFREGTVQMLKQIGYLNG